MRDVGLKIVSALVLLAMVGALVRLVWVGYWIGAVVLAVAGIMAGLLLAAWIIGVRNTPRSGVYK